MIEHVYALNTSYKKILYGLLYGKMSYAWLSYDFDPFFHKNTVQVIKIPWAPTMKSDPFLDF